MSPGNQADCSYYAPVIDQARQQVDADSASMDKGYDSDAIRQDLHDHGQCGHIPSRSNRKIQYAYSLKLYRERNRVERLFGKLKHFRAIATRYQKLSATFLALVLFGLTILIARSIR